jgi:hypothetical protein
MCVGSKPKCEHDVSVSLAHSLCLSVCLSVCLFLCVRLSLSPSLPLSLSFSLSLSLTHAQAKARLSDSASSLQVHHTLGKRFLAVLFLVHTALSV